jgi:hypothetical protein
MAALKVSLGISFRSATLCRWFEIEKPMKRASLAIFSLLVCAWCLVPAKDQMDVQWNASPAPVEPNEIIAVFRSSKPEGAEKKVAKGHKLEFVRWLDIGLTNGRAALYRIIDGRSAAEVLAALKRDPHVSAAQRNKRYRWSPH